MMSVQEAAELLNEALEGKNRRGQDWVVFDIDMKSILGKYEINKNNH